MNPDAIKGRLKPKNAEDEDKFGVAQREGEVILEGAGLLPALGRLLQQQLRAAGYSDEKAAYAAGVALPDAQKVLEGDPCATLETFVALAAAAGCRVDLVAHPRKQKGSQPTEPVVRTRVAEALQKIVHP